MKKLILMAGAMTLAACEASTSDPVETDTDADMMVEETASDEGPAGPGTYVVYNAEGELNGTATNLADGTYTWTNAEGEQVEGNGQWENRDGKFCIDWNEPEGEEDTGETCWTRGEAGEDGRVAWTSDAEEPETVYVEEPSV